MPRWPYDPALKISKSRTHFRHSPLLFSPPKGSCFYCCARLSSETVHSKSAAVGHAFIFGAAVCVVFSIFGTGAATLERRAWRLLFCVQDCSNSLHAHLIWMSKANSAKHAQQMVLGHAQRGRRCFSQSAIFIVIRLVALSSFLICFDCCVSCRSFFHH